MEEKVKFCSLLQWDTIHIVHIDNYTLKIVYKIINIYRIKTICVLSLHMWFTCIWQETNDINPPKITSQIPI